MAGARSVNVCALNVVIHDKDKRNYVKLLRDALETREIVRFNRTHAASLVGIYGEYYQSVKYPVGLIYRFVNVEPPYFDTDQNELLLDAEGNPKVILPANIKSNTKDVYFVLLEDVHRIVIDTRNISPAMAQEFFEKLFESENVAEKYGQVDVSVVSEPETIEEILKIHSLRNLSIKIAKPNPVGMNRFDEMVLGELEEQGADVLEHDLRTRREGILPNDRTRMYMHAATTHGKVYAAGKDFAGMKVEVSSENFPIKHQAKRENKETFKRLLVRASLGLWDIIVRKGHA